jgi:hypothetical protein
MNMFSRGLILAGRRTAETKHAHFHHIPFTRHAKKARCLGELRLAIICADHYCRFTFWSSKRFGLYGWA